jgi:branched-chain amino acid transport system ATP-binding protein
VTAAPALAVEGLVAGYARGLPILHGVDLVLPEGSLTAVIGPNGAGKSTLVKAVAGLVPVSAGRVLLGGREITGIRPDEMGPLGLAYVPQTDNVFRSLSIRQNLALALRRVADREARFAELAALFPPLGEKADDRAGSLSGGQRQMLAVAMALAARPRVVMMDEPSAGLSPKVAQEVLDLARSLTAGGVSVLLVEQNVRQALRVADRCYVLAEGRNRLDGPAASILADPAVGEIYLGGRRDAAEAGAGVGAGAA